MRKVKWENVVFVLMMGLGVCAIIHHIKLSGFYSNLLIEIPIYYSLAKVFQYIVKDIRKNPSNWEL